jgi:hypothetical protein
MIWWILFGSGLFYITFALYLTMMHLKSARDHGKLTTASKFFGYPLLIIGLIVDVIFNVVAGTIMFIEIPKEFLFTTRVSRLNDGTDWRGKLANWFCEQLLDPFDPAGKHCR